MRLVLVLAAVAVIAYAGIASEIRVRKPSHHKVADRKAPLKERVQKALQLWGDYKEEYAKTYDEEDDETNAMEAFVKNVIRVEEHAKKDSTFDIGLNHIADLPFSEYKKLNGFKRSFMDRREKNSTKWRTPFNVVAPESVDWREHGLVTHVKNQGMCGSCWAFSAVGALEGQHKRASGEMVELSEQNLVDCSTKFGNHGCEGGLMDFAFEYVKQNHGIDTEDSYPYKGKNMKCHFNKKDVGADDTGYVDLPEGDEDALKVALATVGPISVAIDAGHHSFQLYKGGVYYEPQCSPEELDHGVLLVGYGTDAAHGDYWLIKNSWGEGWGEKGYIRMARNKNNHCGIATKASYPLV